MSVGGSGRTKKDAKADAEIAAALAMIADTAFKVVALRRGDHWRLSEAERNELGVNMMRCVKTLPMIPEDKLGRYAPWFGLAMCSYAIVVPRAETDARRQQLPTAAQPRVGTSAFERINADVPLPPDLAAAVERGDVQVRHMTPDEYAAFMREQNGDVPEYPTLAATDETLLDRVIQETIGVDQGTLANDARASGRLSE